MIDDLPEVFKGIALFTPGGDLIYGIDPHRQTQWHIHLCHSLQTILNLAASPHFLTPGYTATVERWRDPNTNQLKTIAEVYPAVQRYIPLLEALFELETYTEWQVAPWQEEYCHRGIIETYRAQFPQLWQQQNLVVRLDPEPPSSAVNISTTNSQEVRSIFAEPIENYVLRLFIASNNARAEQTLSNIHQLLEEGLTSPYTLKVIDIAKNPEQAVANQIVITPTLIRVSPKPVRRIVGQLNDISRVLNIISNF